MKSPAIFATLLAAGCATAPFASASADIAINGTRVFPESVTSDAEGTIYVGSVPGIIYRAKAGETTAQPWVTPDATNGLTSLFGVLADDKSGTLWVCNNPPFGGPAPAGAKSGVKAFDLKTGQIKGDYPFPEGPAACNDLAVDRFGTTYVTDTAGGRIFKLPSGAAALELVVATPDLVGIDGIAFAEDGKMYINNVRQHTVQRVNVRTDGSFDSLTTLTLSQPVNGPDALRPVSGNRFLQAEGPGNRVTFVDVDGDSAVITPVKTGLDSSPGVTHFGKTGYATEGKIGYLFDPALRDKDPGAFMVRSFPLPE